jgi:AbrB family looped-hinge helix DNA binding protein
MPASIKAATAHALRAKISGKGQVTIPAEIRRSLGVRPGDHVRFEHKEGTIRLVRDSNESVFDKWRGIGTGFPIQGEGPEAIVAFFREMRGHDDFN